MTITRMKSYHLFHVSDYEYVNYTELSDNSKFYSSGKHLKFVFLTLV